LDYLRRMGSPILARPMEVSRAILIARRLVIRVDALVWAFTELLVEPMPGWASFEFTRRQYEAAMAAREAAKPKPIEGVLAPGSVEYQIALQEGRIQPSRSIR
jgi:hypothetical protein